MNKEKLSYFFIRLLTSPFGWIPYTWIHRVGNLLGLGAYYLMPEWRKQALSNLALAKDLSLSNDEVIRYAKQSFQNLAINCLEYPKLAREKNLSRVIRCENPQIAQELHQKGQGIIFFCGHQANWEVLFLDGTTRMRGVAIGRSIKNKLLYDWIVSIREKQGGKIIAPHNAVREGYRALRKGTFLGIVGDQGMPDSGYAFPFLGRRAWTSTAPALLAYRTNSPIIVADTRRVVGKYQIHYSDPIWPDLSKTADEEVVRLMNGCLTLLQESIKQAPGQWLWQHNRWKQQTAKNIYKRFRHDCVCVILPKDLEPFLPHLATLRSIYALNILIAIAPVEIKEADETILYSEMSETLRNDLRFKLVLNFTDYKPIVRHYKRLAAFDVIDLDELRILAGNQDDLSEVFKRSLCRPGSIW